MRRISCIVLMLLCAAVQSMAQKRVSADIETKQVYNGKVTTTTRTAYCTNSGLLVVVFHSPQEYIQTSNIKGETKVYFPKEKKVYSDNSGKISSKDDLMSIFLNGWTEDLGLRMLGYKLSSSVREDDGCIRKSFVSSDKDKTPRIDLVLQDHLPIYCEYFNSSSIVMSKAYFSNYIKGTKMVLPARVTQIDYNGQKDSVVTRTIYSNLCVDGENPWFEYHIPSDAKPISMEELKQL